MKTHIALNSSGLYSETLCGKEKLTIHCVSFLKEDCTCKVCRFKISIIMDEKEYITNENEGLLDILTANYRLLKHSLLTCLYL